MTDSPWRCAGCGTPGKISTIVTAPEDNRPVLKIAFGREGGRPMLVCDLCRPGESPTTPQPEE
jgi:hypothetical protein